MIPDVFRRPKRLRPASEDELKRRVTSDDENLRLRRELDELKQKYKALLASTKYAAFNNPVDIAHHIHQLSSNLRYAIQAAHHLIKGGVPVGVEPLQAEYARIQQQHGQMCQDLIDLKIPSL